MIELLSAFEIVFNDELRNLKLIGTDERVFVTANIYTAIARTPISQKALRALKPAPRRRQKASFLRPFNPHESPETTMQLIDALSQDPAYPLLYQLIMLEGNNPSPYNKRHVTLWKVNARLRENEIAIRLATRKGNMQFWMVQIED